MGHQVHVFWPSLFFERTSGGLALLFKTFLRFLHFLFPVVVELLSDLLFDEIFAKTLFLFTNLFKFVSTEDRLVIFVIVCIVNDINIQVFILILISILTLVKRIIFFFFLEHYEMSLPIDEGSAHSLGKLAAHEVVIVRRVLLMEQVVQRLV